MDQIVNRCSSMMSSLPEDAPSSSLETSSTYSSPVSATAPPSQPGASPVIGLGISNCGLESTYNHVTNFQSPLSYPTLSTTLKPNYLAPHSATYDACLELQNFSNEPCFPICNSLPETSLSPLSFYGSQPMSASPSFNSNLDIQCSQELFRHMPVCWASTPSSGPTTPKEVISATKFLPMGIQQLSEQVQYCTTREAPPLQPLSTGTAYHAVSAEENAKCRVERQVSSVPVEPYPLPRTLDQIDARNKVEEETGSSPISIETIPSSGKGFACRTCGRIFTRRSNCTEHERRQHDPNSRKAYKCTECQKAFGRNSDLRRHVKNLHLKPRANPCQWCGECFARAESLERHLVNCSHNPTNIAPYPLSYSFEAGMYNPVPIRSYRNF